MTGCYAKKKLDNSNPTSYIFDANIEQVEKSIIDGFGNYQMECMVLCLNGDRDYYNYIYKDSKNIYDAILNSLCSFKSKIYFKFGKPLYYQANFHIHLDSISENKIQVEIFTLDPEIIVFGIGYGHLGYTWIKKVSPSTIEEYEILLAIGAQLGQEGMPECNYPKKWLKYHAKQQEQIKQQLKELEKLKSKQTR